MTPTNNNPPFLGPLSDQTTLANTPVSLPLTATDTENDMLTFVATDPTNFANPPQNVKVSFNQTTNLLTVTPNKDFVGTTQILFGVRDQTARNGKPEIRRAVRTAASSAIIMSAAPSFSRRKACANSACA